MPSESILAQAIAEHASPVVAAHTDFDRLMKRIGDSRFVLLGEATHGSHEFYRLRAQITRRLIVEHGFTAIAAEADWPDAYRINRYVRGVAGDRDAVEALAEFKRFPQWMWRNTDVVELAAWLHRHNEMIEDPRRRVGFYGLDLYSLHASMAAVINYLDTHDAEAAQRARERYACFDGLGEEPAMYGHLVSRGVAPDCEREVLAQLVDMLKQRDEPIRRSGLFIDDAQFEAEQNARVVARAEEYYRSMYFGDVSTWNLRDTHMADTLDAIAARHPKVVVWAHNSHVGDSAAMMHRAERHEITLGHLCRERHDDTVLVGFTTHHGTVTAATNWDGITERKTVRPALPGSYEMLFHRTGVPRFLLMLGDLGEAAAALHEPRLERAIGVIYRPQTERVSHYFDVRLPDQLDAVIHVDETRALVPLARTATWERGEFPETFPTGL